MKGACWQLNKMMKANNPTKTHELGKDENLSA
jgi:hypothetical protein